MCGIAGHAVAQPAGQAHVDATQRMTDALAHRGPDAQGVWKGSHVVLGHRRLSIIDLDAASNQPFVSDDGRYAMTYNGEIYNYRALRDELKDHRFRTKSDTEVLLAAYMKWGEACLDRLDGMFVFAIWDTRDETLFLARDRFGVKPLYIHQQGGDLFFASEVRALLASGQVPRKLDEQALVDHLRYGTVHAPTTIIAGVRMLRPGHLLRWSTKGCLEEAWWSMVNKASDKAADLSIEEVHREVRDRFFSAVEKRMVADVPFGAFLSGGIDSSAVVGAMSQASKARIHTFTVTFDDAKFSEAGFAKIIAKKFGTKHTEIRLLPTEMLRLMPEALSAMDHPSADGPNTWVVSKHTKAAGIDMALSGLGGDELFAGYEVFKRSVALQGKQAIMFFPRPVRALAGMVMNHRNKGAMGWKAAELLKLRSWRIADTYPLARALFSDDALKGLLQVKVLPTNTVAQEVVELLDRQGGSRSPLLSQVSFAELSTYLPDVLLRDADQMSMAHALEVRTPFLDHGLAEFVLGIPDQMKYPHTAKKLLTDSLGDLLPREVTDRPKMGFTLPWEQWLRDELHGFCAAHMEALGRRPQFKREGVANLWRRFEAKDPAVTWSRVWSLVVLEEWLTANAIE